MKMKWGLGLLVICILISIAFTAIEPEPMLIESHSNFPYQENKLSPNDDGDSMTTGEASASASSETVVNSTYTSEDSRPSSFGFSVFVEHDQVDDVVVLIKKLVESYE